MKRALQAVGFPFFQEGSDLYDTRIQQVYTRSSKNPMGVAKLTGRQGRLSCGYIGGLDEDTPIILPFEERSRFSQAGDSYSNIFRVQRTIGRSSSVGGLVADRRYLENVGSGSTVGINGEIRLSQRYSFEAQFVAPKTVEKTMQS